MKYPISSEQNIFFSEEYLTVQDYDNVVNIVSGN
jgi:hypothetical protein